MNTMKKTLSALAAVLALAASGMEWSFDGPEPLRSEDGKTVLTGSVTVAEKAGITGNALRFDGKTDFLELALTGDNRPRREMTLSFWVRPEEGCTVLPIVRSPRRDVTFNGTPGFFWFEVHTADGRQIYNGCANPQRLKPGEWHHFALVYDRTGLAAYVDGRPAGRAETDGAPGELRFSGVPWRIGGRLYEADGRRRRAGLRWDAASEPARSSFRFPSHRFPRWNGFCRTSFSPERSGRL